MFFKRGAKSLLPVRRNTTIFTCSLRTRPWTLIRRDLTAIFSQNSIKCSCSQTSSRKLRWARTVAHMGHNRSAQSVLGWKTSRKQHSKDPGVEARIILKWILRKQNVMLWLNSSEDKNKCQALGVWIKSFKLNRTKGISWIFTKILASP